MSENANPGQSDWREAVDDDLFPICNEDRVGETHLDEYGVTYVCTLVEGLGYSWKAE